MGLTSYDRNIYLERKFTRTIKAILGNYFISQDVVADRCEATDFQIFHVKPFRVAARLRRYEYFCVPQYRSEFTIRYSLPSGGKTELEKINEGLVDYMIYGFVNKEEKKIIQYFIGDLNIFREVSLDPFDVKPNNPHDSDLAIYKLSQFPEDFILKFYKRPQIPKQSRQESIWHSYKEFSR